MPLCGNLLVGITRDALAGVKPLPNQALQPTTPPRYVFHVDLSSCDSTRCHLRLPEPGLRFSRFFSVGVPRADDYP
jgi:hypothetical protein